MNHVTGFQLYTVETENSDTLGNCVDITVFHEKELSSGFSNKSYHSVSMHSIYRVMACIKYLIVSCPDTRMIGMNAEVQE